MRLFYSAASPYVRKVLVCAEEAGLRAQIELTPVAVSPVSENAEVAGR